MLPKIDGIKVLRKIKKSHPKMPVIMMTAHGSVELAVEAMKIGAYDFLSKPVNSDELKITVRNAVEARTLHEEIAFLKSQLKERYEFSNIIGKSPAMQHVFKLIEKVADSNIPVLIQGESGSGKELVAKAIHFNGHRKDAPFIDINCAAIPETLLESELFGYEKGAFTNAIKRKEGKFELANGGTLFLDEIGEMDLSLQVKILRAVEEKAVERIGGKEKVNVNCRIISATNKDLKDSIEAKAFREDLYYRIAVYDWPGNVRELENTIYRATVLSEGETIEAHHLAFEIQKLEQTDIPIAEKSMALKETSSDHIIPFSDVEKEVLKHALQVSGGNISQAAKELKIGRATFYRKLKKFNLIKKGSRLNI